MTEAPLSTVSPRRQSTVAVGEGADAALALADALEQAGASEALGEAAPRPRGECSVVVKATLPPGSAAGARAPGYADPAIVEGLAGWLEQQGFGSVAIAVPGRDGAAAAEAVGYAPGRVLGLSAEAEQFHYGGTIGDHLVSTAWRAADIRILAGRARPDPALFYQGVLVSALGAIPEADALARRLASPYDAGVAACDALEVLPVALGVLDAWAPTGGRVLVSPDLLALDWVFGELTGLDGPELNAVVREALQRQDQPELRRRGNLARLGSWRNPSPLRAVLATAGAGRPWGALTGAREVPWTAR